MLRKLFLILALCGCALAQQAGTRPAPPKPPTERPEYHITPEEAKALFRDVREILDFVAKDTGLPIEHDVTPKLADRQQVAAYVQREESEDEEKKRIVRSEVVMKKFGLLPPDFDLNQFFADVLREQIAGYYDPKTQNVYLLDWIEPEAQKPVMAHELTHALQDQRVHLEPWSRVGTAEEPDAQKEVDEDEMSTARHAVTEGQGMIVMVDYMLAPVNQTVLDRPQFVERMRAGAAAQMSGSPVLSHAPIYIREALLFPYTFGLGFEVALLRRGGKKQAFADVLENPPKTTREVMEPETYLSHQDLEPVGVPDLAGALAPKYKRYDVGAMGEFDVYAFLKQSQDAEVAEELYPTWNGGFYYALVSASAPEKPTTKDIALVYFSRWRNTGEAQRFAGLYAGTLRKKYKLVQPLDSNSTTRSWKTDEGVVSIETRGEEVLVLESFDEAGAKRVRELVWQMDPPIK